MRPWAVAASVIVLFFAIGFIAVPYGYICGVPLLVIGLVLLIVGGLTTKELPAPAPPPVYYVQQPVYYQPYPQMAPPPVIQQKEVVTREVVKVRCRYCGALVDEAVNECPRCRAPMR